MSDPPRDESLPEALIFKARGWLLVEWSALLLAATLLVGCLVFTGATTRLDNAIYDATLKVRQRPAPADIVLVGIDFASSTKLGPWPWPRETVAGILNGVARDHPRAVVLQFIFASRGSPVGDAALRAAIASAPVFLPELLDQAGRGMGAHLIAPIAQFASVAAGVGLNNPSPDLDGIVRRVVLYAPYEAGKLSDVAVLAAGGAPGQPRGAARPSLPFAGAGSTKREEVLIPFAGPPGHFQQVSAADVLQGKVKPGRFTNKYVLIGPTAPGLLDNFPTPVSGADGMPTVEIEANTLDAVLHHHLARPLVPTATVILSLILLWVTFFELLWLKPTQFALQPIGSVAIVAGAAGALFVSGVWFPPMTIVIVRTIVQIVWSSRRLQAASDYFAQELAELQTRSGAAIVPIAMEGRLPMGDSVTRQMILIDETKRRIRELRRFVTDVLANFPDPVMVVTSQGRILMYNEPAVDLSTRLGRPAEPGAYVQPILQDLAEATGNRTIQWPPDTGAGAPAPRGVAPGGRILEARYAPTGQEGGEAKGWTVHLADVTAQVSAIRQREEALQLFTHDMRAPQSAILAALEHEDFRSVPQEMRDRIARNAMRTVALAEEFVRLAQAETAEYYRFEPIDFFHLLGDAADSLWPIARSAAVEIKVEDPEREFVVDADRGLMSRALINLLDNAVRFTPPGGCVVCSLVETRLRDRLAVSCSITDQSDGMTAEQQRGLFDPCEKPPLPGENDDASPDPGSGARLGMGLTMVQTVVHRHDGVFEWRSDSGGGMVFTVTLPLCIDEECAEPEQASSRGVEQMLLPASRLAFGT